MDQRTAQLLNQIARADEGKALLDDFTVYAEYRSAIKHRYADLGQHLERSRARPVPDVGTTTSYPRRSRRSTRATSSRTLKGLRT
jgi:hypothetical protein